VADRTWTHELKRKGKHVITFQAKMSKDQADKLKHLLSEPLEIEKHRKELCGIIGVDEREHKYYTPFSEQEMRDPENYDKRIKEYLASFPALFTLDNYKTILPLINDIMKHHVHIVDSRKTQEEHDNEIKLMNERVNKHDEQRRIEKEKRKN